MTPAPAIASTFGDDPAIRELNILGTAAGNDRHRGVQAQTLLDAHGHEGQLGQVVPKQHPPTVIQGAKPDTPAPSPPAAPRDALYI